jgi:hypothetical protein
LLDAAEIIKIAALRGGLPSPPHRTISSPVVMSGEMLANCRSTTTAIM